MSIEGLEHYSKDQLIGEFINRQTVAGIVIYYREDAKDGRVQPGELVITKSPPLPQEEVESLLKWGLLQVPGMFGVTSAMALSSEPPPLRRDEAGTVRIGSGRISLDLIVEQYENGLSPEEMVRAYDSLALADVYAAIAYYLRHRDQVNEYLARRDAEADESRTNIETEHPPITRDELVARRTAWEKDHAPTGN